MPVTLFTTDDFLQEHSTPEDQPVEIAPGNWLCPDGALLQHGLDRGGNMTVEPSGDERLKSVLRYWDFRHTRAREALERLRRDLIEQAQNASIYSNLPCPDLEQATAALNDLKAKSAYTRENRDRAEHAWITSDTFQLQAARRAEVADRQHRAALVRDALLDINLDDPPAPADPSPQGALKQLNELSQTLNPDPWPGPGQKMQR